MARSEGNFANAGLYRERSQSLKASVLAHITSASHVLAGELPSWSRKVGGGSNAGWRAKASCCGRFRRAEVAAR
ncbi:MAG: hypothetical protein M1396_03965 [Chloroflexi bacterium]|nr:hypothetical protein [Chloroflexota bacterium]